MSSDQEQRLEELGSRLCEVFLVEADPTNWPGADKAPKDHDKDERGDRAWSLKGANQLGLLVARTLELRQRIKWAREAAAGTPNPAQAAGGVLGSVEDPEADIKRFEREASRLMEKLGARGAR